MSIDLKKIEDDIFCLNFELAVFAGATLRGELERWVPGFSGLYVENEHQQRYAWVADFVKDKKVLDIACGVGRGSYLMATAGQAQKVIGGDIDKQALRYAEIKNSHSRVDFRKINAENFNLEEKFDVIVSFETIEHLSTLDNYLLNIKNHLTATGSFFVSTPISEKDLDSQPLNKYHIQEWGFTSFHKLVEKHFDINSVYLQFYHKKNKNIIYYFKKFFRLFLGIKEKEINNFPQLIKWDADKYHPDKISQKYSGYQILECRLKSETMSDKNS